MAAPGDVAAVRRARPGDRRREPGDGVQPGFYNLFLALGAVLGLVLFWWGPGDLAIAGRALMLFTTACMVLAAAVLTTTGRGYLRAALVQGTLPLVGFVLFAFA